MNMMPFMASPEVEAYVKKLESLEAKHKKNENLVCDERFDGVSKEKNLELYELYLKKLGAWPYNKRPANVTLVAQLTKRANDFADLDAFEQCKTLLQIQGVFGRIKQADLKALHESASSGITAPSLNISNWKKNYTDVRIIDQSASGLFEKVSDNLLDLL
jgi:CRISPR-associated endonuclease Csn1